MTIRQLVISIIALINVPLAFLILVLSAIWRTCLDFGLSRKIGKNYGGLLSGRDAFFMAENDVSNGVGTILVVVDNNFDRNFFKFVKNSIRKRIFGNSNKFPKFSGVFKHAWGHTYVLKNALEPDDCVRELKENVNNQSDLQEILSKYANVDLPKNHTAFWEVLVGRKSIQIDEKNCNFFILRLHQAAADDLNSLLSNKPIKKRTEKRNLYSIFKTTLFHFYTLSLTLYVALYVLFSKKVGHLLYGQKISGKRILTWKTEGPDATDKIKKIENKFVGVNVLLTAISASFEDYFDKHFDALPEEVILTLATDEMDELKSGMMLMIPIRWKPKSLVERLLEFRARHQSQMNPISISINYFLFNCFPTYLPRRITRLLKERQNFTLSLSFREQCWCLFDGHVAKMIPWTPLYGRIGMGLAVNSFGGQLKFSFVVDEAVINSVDRANEILNGISRNINKMENDLQYFS